MDDLISNEFLDLKGVPCPQNTAKTLLKLEGMDSGEILEVVVDDGEPIENVPPALEEEGFRIVARKKTKENIWHLFIRVL
jgi:tRNA 2-thiouridine synthesizing protein A